MQGARDMSGPQRNEYYYGLLIIVFFYGFVVVHNLTQWE